MAGESPDKSVDAGAPGAAESSAERDPRLSVFRPRDPKDRDARAGEAEAEAADVEMAAEAEAVAEAEADAEHAAEPEPEPEAEPEPVHEPEPVAGNEGERDPLREAVAAWVAKADAPAETSERVESAADAVEGAAADPAADPDADAEAPAEEPEADEPAPAPKREAAPDARSEEPESASGSGSAPASDSASAFASGSGSAVGKPEAVDSERTAVFRAVKLDAAAEKPTPEPEPAPTPEGSADSERTAVFRAPKLDAAPAPAAEKSKPAPAVEEPADSERTAVFRAVKLDAGSGSGARSGSVAGPRAGSDSVSGPGSAPAVPAEDEPKPAPAVKESADSERTAVFRVPKVDTVKAETPKPAAAKPAAPKPTLAKPAEARFAPAQAEPAQAEPAAEAPKGSTFVPLRPESPAPAPEVRQRPKLPAAVDRSERTTQQPLPPKPPLDMLADLTNNPPPPPSPMRTAVRRFKIYAPLVVLVAIILAVVQLVRPLPEPKLVMTAKSSYTFDGSKPQLPWPAEGQAYMAAAGLGTLGQSGEQKPVPIASVTKSMTAYIILRDHPMKKGEQGAMIDVDKTAETEGKKNNSTDNESTLDTVKEGEKISEYDAIAALMIPSANNIARLLARWDSGSQEAFVKKMNDTAKELGMTNTTYTDPSGLDATTVSTAEDQVKLGLKLVEMEALLDITKKTSWVDPSGKNWRNWNGLTGPTGALGIKTGTTTKAGGNLLFAAQKKVGKTNQLIVGAVLGQHKAPIIDSVLAASKQLMLETQKVLDGATVVKKGEVVGYVDDGLGGRTPVVATADVQAVGWASLTVDVKLADGGAKMPQTATAGTEVGLLTVGEGASQVKVPVALQSDLAAPGIGSKLTRVG
ncbi:D-alanyl-D-alanine carboxypeptidase [Streptomyces sp. MB09-01]|uniref:D-alanyl-D-alanine carboxypeptidase family protein n=1 Tax=Streptomyces sp. MB09-01 TaxID=3028666 RepID=UPI0029AC6D91|nr:D-alanyl-D-alanine carboxypeptidase [Streptomyces sp. MB09-01]MDX3534669.1 D-alanyl-D-alanine carboxypeptidase [Streptomyces sp. MB09-01]